MKWTHVEATVLATFAALAGCGGELPPGPQPAFSDGGLASGPAGSRWSETDSASGGELESTESGLSTVITYQEISPPRSSASIPTTTRRRRTSPRR